jgi:hypothetical protein
MGKLNEKAFQKRKKLKMKKLIFTHEKLLFKTLIVIAIARSFNFLNSTNTF